MNSVKITALDAAKWFIRNKMDSPRNTLEGNMKLQKLLFFSQLIHMVKTNDFLFDDHMYAFDHGTVIENVRIRYRNDNENLIAESYNGTFSIGTPEEDTLKVTKNLFGTLDAKSLSVLNHQFDCWRVAHERSLVGDYKIKEKGIIDKSQISRNDINKLNQILDKVATNLNSPYNNYEIINGIKFYYDPNEIQIDDYVIQKLNEFEGSEDTSYTVYRDPRLGVVVV